MIKSFRWHILEIEIIESVLKFPAVLAEFCHGILWFTQKIYQTSYGERSLTHDI